MRPEAKLFTAKDGREFVLLLDHRGIVAAEKAGETGFGGLLVGLGEGRLGCLVALTYGALRTHHPDITIEDVWDLLEVEEQELGLALGEAIKASRPGQIALRRAEEAANPPPAAMNGTGTPSSPPGSKKGSTKRGSSTRRPAATRS